MPTYKPMIRAALAALLSGAVTPPPASGEDGAAPGDGFDVTSFALALTLDVQARTVQRRETITLHATADDVRQLRFSGNALTIDRAVLDGVPARPCQATLRPSNRQGQH